VNKQPYTGCLFFSGWAWANQTRKKHFVNGNIAEKFVPDKGVMIR
jgi:hypothetical protein